MGLRLHRNKAFHSVALLAGLLVAVLDMTVLIGDVFNLAVLKSTPHASATMSARAPTEMLLCDDAFVHERSSE